MQCNIAIWLPAQFKHCSFWSVKTLYRRTRLAQSGTQTKTKTAAATTIPKAARKRRGNGGRGKLSVCWRLAPFGASERLFRGLELTIPPWLAPVFRGGKESVCPRRPELLRKGLWNFTGPGSSKQGGGWDNWDNWDNYFCAHPPLGQLRQLRQLFLRTSPRRIIIGWSGVKEIELLLQVLLLVLYIIILL